MTALTLPSRPPVGRRSGPFLFLLIAVAVLVVVGAIMGLSATAAPSLASTGSAWSLPKVRIILLAIGVVVMFATLRLDYHHWEGRIAVVLLGFSLLLLVLTLHPTFGITNNGARRWLGIGPMPFQPSEVAKLPFVIFVARLMSRPARAITDARASVHPVLILTAGVSVLLLMQPHLGATILIAGIAMMMLFLGGASLARLAFFAAIGAGLTALFVWSTPWRWDRIVATLDPWADPLGSGYQPLRALHAMATGGLSGVSLGDGRSKWGFLPDAHTDFIFAVIGEELGMVGTLAVVVTFAAFAAAGLCITVRAPDRFGMLLAAGITAWISLQAALNIGAVLGILPVIGITLPLLSFGGTSILSTLAAVGVLLNVARQCE